MFVGARSRQLVDNLVHFFAIVCVPRTKGALLDGHVGDFRVISLHLHIFDVLSYLLDRAGQLVITRARSIRFHWLQMRLLEEDRIEAASVSSLARRYSLILEASASQRILGPLRLLFEM